MIDFLLAGFRLWGGILKKRSHRIKVGGTPLKKDEPPAVIAEPA
jgi:hypothetical protein